MKRLLILLLTAACATTPQPQQPCRIADTTINPTLWMQYAAEYEASGEQVYGSARRLLETAIADKGWTAPLEQPSADPSLPPAIILDIDETTLDTSDFQTRLIRSGGRYTEAQWNEYVANETSPPVPGVIEFLREAQRRGVAIFFITNRRAPGEARLRQHLTSLGIPLDPSQDTLLMRDERDWKARDKSSRRAFVASRYRVIMVLGDDLNDFLNAEGKTLEERSRLVDENRARWGRTWFMIPNPVYGSWERALGIQDSMSACEQFERKIRALRPKQD